MLFFLSKRQQKRVGVYFEPSCMEWLKLLITFAINLDHLSQKYCLL